MSKYENKNFVVKDIWNRKEHKRKDGTTFSHQKIINEDDKNLNIWDIKDDMKGLLKVGHKYHAAGITIKQNRDGYDEYHTGKYSVVSPLVTKANQEFHHEVPDKPAYNAVKPVDPNTFIEIMGKPYKVESAQKITGDIEVPSYTKKDLHDVIIHIGNRLDYIVEKLGWISANIELLEKKL